MFAAETICSASLPEFILDLILTYRCKQIAWRFCRMMRSSATSHLSPPHDAIVQPQGQEMLVRTRANRRIHIFNLSLSHTHTHTLQSVMHYYKWSRTSRVLFSHFALNNTSSSHHRSACVCLCRAFICMPSICLEALQQEPA